MRYNLFSIVAGTEACNARCGFCVSKMTPANGIEGRLRPVNWRNFHIAARLARESGISTAMITSKGEATLFPQQVTEYLDALQREGFPLIELQTNGIPLAEQPAKYDTHLRDWYQRNLSMIAISVVHHDPVRNRDIYLPHKQSYIDLPALLDTLHDVGFSTRLACVMVQGYVDEPERIDEMIAYARAHRVEQLTVRPVNLPEESRDPAAYAWTREHLLTARQRTSIENHLASIGTRLQRTSYGAITYDVGGQNVCLTNSLTIAPEADETRQLIFFPDGHIRYDWQHPGAIIL